MDATHVVPEVQTVPHAPQDVFVVRRSTSHPLAALPSQSAVSLGQARKHAPARHTPDAFGPSEQVWLHLPQFAGSERRSTLHVAKSEHRTKPSRQGASGATSGAISVTGTRPSASPSGASGASWNGSSEVGASEYDVASVRPASDTTAGGLSQLASVAITRTLASVLRPISRTPTEQRLSPHTRIPVLIPPAGGVGNSMPPRGGRCEHEPNRRATSASVY